MLLLIPGRSHGAGLTQDLRKTFRIRYMVVFRITLRRSVKLVGDLRLLGLLSGVIGESLGLSFPNREEESRQAWSDRGWEIALPESFV
jgi:hypothetical protein